MTGGRTVATVGTFDGIHRGHQAVLREVVRRAGTRTSLLVTFDPHPLEVVNPSAAPRLLTLSDEKRVLAAAVGVARVEVVAFTPELARSIITRDAQPAHGIDEHFLMDIAKFDR